MITVEKSQDFNGPIFKNTFKKIRPGVYASNSRKYWEFANRQWYAQGCVCVNSDRPISEEDAIKAIIENGWEGCIPK